MKIKWHLKSGCHAQWSEHVETVSWFGGASFSCRWPEQVASVMTVDLSGQNLDEIWVTDEMLLEIFAPWCVNFGIKMELLAGESVGHRFQSPPYYHHWEPLSKNPPAHQWSHWLIRPSLLCRLHPESLEVSPFPPFHLSILFPHRSRGNSSSFCSSSTKSTSSSSRSRSVTVFLLALRRSAASTLIATTFPHLRCNWSSAAVSKRLAFQWKNLTIKAKKEKRRKKQEKCSFFLPSPVHPLKDRKKQLFWILIAFFISYFYVTLTFVSLIRC